jgi:arabinogalactan endo-1,4-beta-galactosidase
MGSYGIGIERIIACHIEQNHDGQGIIWPKEVSPYQVEILALDTNDQAIMNAARSAGAAGVFYWEPTWTAVKGNGWDPANPGSGSQWENQALFDFEGVALPAMSEFKS